MKDNHPLVSIIISAYNHENCVADSIDSVLDQNYENFELHIVDDGSTDSTNSIIEKTIAEYVPDNRIHYYHYPENSGFSWTDEVYSMLKGKYICAISADDAIKKDKIEKQVYCLENNCKEYHGCFSHVEIRSKDRTTEEFMDKLFNSTVENDQYRLLHRLFVYGNFLNAPSMMFRRDVFMELGGYNWGYRQLQDYALWLKVLCRYNIMVIPEKLTIYNVLENSLSTLNAFSRTLLVSETEAILHDTLLNMSDEVFIKTFCDEIDPAWGNTSTDVKCQKVLLSLTGKITKFTDVGVRLYYAFSRDRLFNQCLFTRYGYSYSKMHKLIYENSSFNALVNGVKPSISVDECIRYLNELLDVVDGKSDKEITSLHIMAFHRICKENDGFQENFIKVLDGLHRCGKLF